MADSTPQAQVEANGNGKVTMAVIGGQLAVMSVQLKHLEEKQDKHHPGPEWRSMAEIKSHMPTLGANYVEALVKVQVREGKMETRRGPDRVTGKVMSLYKVVK